MSTRLAIAFSLVALATLGGCSGSNDQGDEASGSLLRKGDLPDNATVVKSLDRNGPCSPRPIIGERAISIAQSPSFVTGKVQLQQVVGLFSSDLDAKRAFAELNSDRRQRCILSAASFAGIAKSLPTRELQFGNESKVMRFQVKRRQVRRLAFADAASVRVGERVTALIVLSPFGRPPSGLVADLLTKATDRLKDPESG
jgi:hypothetical protein